MSVYGDMLLYFAEQRTTVTVYDMTPDINAGWTIVPNSQETVSCIYQHTNGDRIKDSNGNLVSSSDFELWTETDGLRGKFLSIDGNVYRLASNAEWIREGGFFRYTCEKVVGNNGLESDVATWNLGGHSFS